MKLVFMLLVAVLGSSNSLQQNPTTQQQCKQQELDACERYLVQSSQPLVILEEDNINININSWREEFVRCCPQLEKVEEKCRCQSIWSIVQRGELKGEQMKEMFLTAKTLPALCGRLSPSRCDFPSPLFFY